MSNPARVLLRPWTVIALCAFSLSLWAADPPRLDQPTRIAGGGMDLKLNGSPGATYAIDISSNLVEWSALSSGIATNGILSLTLDLAPNHPALFYRGRAVVDTLPPLSLTLGVNTNTTVLSMATPRGGSSVLYGADGTRYTLTLPSNSIPSATIFTMTEVTNLSGLPFAQRPIGAVRIEPADFVLWGAAALEISFGTNIDRRQVTSFACQPDGSAFRLVIDRVSTNTILIPITRAGVYGSVVSTAQELADAARREIRFPPPAPADTLHSAAAFECQAEDKALAKAVDDEIVLALAMRSQVSAERIGNLRRGQSPQEMIDAQLAFAAIEDEMCDAYMALIESRLLLATVNCALGKVLSQQAIGLSRQGSLLGGGGEEGCAALSSIPYCAILTNCVTEIKDCCEQGKKGSAMIAEIYSLQRQETLLGVVDCIKQPMVDDTIEACSSNIWTGSLSMHAYGYTNRTRISPGSVSIFTEEYESTFEGSIIESTEVGTPDTGLIIDLRISGQIFISDFSSDSLETSGDCGTILHLHEEKGLASRETEYGIQISIEPDGSFIMFGSNRTPTDIGVSALHTDIDIVQKHFCDAPPTTVNKTTTTPTRTLGMTLGLVQGKLQDLKVISGSQPSSESELTPPLQIFFGWNFTRRTVPPP